MMKSENCGRVLETMEGINYLNLSLQEKNIIKLYATVKKKYL